MNKYYYKEFYLKPTLKWIYRIGFLALSILLMANGCRTVFHPAKVSEKKLQKMGYAVQLGAFSNFDNAARMTKYLNQKTSNAYYFIHRKGLYKVRFGNYSSRDRARLEAEKLRNAGKINEYYIVSPHDYPVYKAEKYGEAYFRDQIVRTAESFVGIPYKWGGTSPNAGFDCSGLTMAVYQLNGLRLPRSSAQQYTYGKWVSKKALKKGDLVFFATSGGNKVSHVGVYTGNNEFIHAPSAGKSINTESLSNRYYVKRYVGAKTYTW
jgi:cell wall-associated NlpC family hydrolase